MKRFWGILHVLLLTFSLSACGKTSPAADRMGNDTFSIAEDKTKGSTNFAENGMNPKQGTVEDEAQELQETAQQGVTESEVDLSVAFQNINGCAVIYLPAQEQYFFFHEEMCRQEVSPYSTFKVISALSGLQNGIIAGELSVMGYDGTDYGNPEWNADLTLEQAFQKSCVWYFRKVIDEVGNDEMQKELDALQYGNCDISEWNGSDINPMPALNGFWLASSLKISPLEQVKVLAKIFEGQSGYNSEYIKIIKRIMLTDEDDTQKIYGKTGSSGKGEAWFVGFAEAAGERKYFAVYLNDQKQKEQISGNKAKEIAQEILKYHLL